MSLCTLSEVKRLLASLGHHPKKALSQNFLINKDILESIVDAAHLEKGASVLEIGPGLGVLTQKLLEIGARVVAVEKDTTLYRHLLAYFDTPTLTLINDDFLKTDLDTILPLNKKSQVVANIPYNITSGVVKKLLNAPHLIASSILMVQKELAEKMASLTGSKNYGFFTLFVQILSDVEILFTIPANSFYPEPKVDSAIVKLTRKSLDPAINLDYLFEIIRLAFTQRRKKLTSSLKNHIPSDTLLSAMKSANIALDARPELITKEQFIALGRALTLS